MSDSKAPSSYSASTAGAGGSSVGISRRRREFPTEEPPAPAVEPEYDDGAFESLIAPLAPTARDALRLRFVDDLDYDRIAIELGTSPEAARQRVSTAVRTLRERVTA